MIKDRNSNDLPEAEEIKKRYQECTKELFKKGLNDWDNQDGVVSLEPDILDYEIKRALGSITMNKTNGSGGIQKAYDLAKKHFIKGGNNRVLLATVTMSIF